MTFKRNEHIFHVMFWDHLVKIYADYQRDFRLIIENRNDCSVLRILSIVSYLLYYRRITKMDKRTGSKVVFMSNHPELGRLDSLDIYVDEIQDGMIYN